MTGPYGDLSSPAPLRAGTRPSSGSSPVFDGKSWRCSQCLLTSGNSKGFQSRQAACGHMQVHKRLPKQQAEGGKKKRKKEVSYASGMSQSCSLSGKQFKSHQASCGHMRVHNNQPQRQVQQDEELDRISLNFKQCSLNVMEGTKKIHMKFDLNKVAPENDERETKVAEGGASLSGTEAQRKDMHMKFDLNKAAPVDDERETKGDGRAVAEGGASLSEEKAPRKNSHMKFDLNNAAHEEGA